MRWYWNVYSLHGVQPAESSDVVSRSPLRQVTCVGSVCRNEAGRWQRGLVISSQPSSFRSRGRPITWTIWTYSHGRQEPASTHREDPEGGIWRTFATLKPRGRPLPMLRTCYSMFRPVYVYRDIRGQLDRESCLRREARRGVWHNSRQTVLWLTIRVILIYNPFIQSDFCPSHNFVVLPLESRLHNSRSPSQNSTRYHQMYSGSPRHHFQPHATSDVAPLYPSHGSHCANDISSALPTCLSGGYASVAPSVPGYHVWNLWLLLTGCRSVPRQFFERIQWFTILKRINVLSNGGNRPRRMLSFVGFPESVTSLDVNAIAITILQLRDAMVQLPNLNNLTLSGALCGGNRNKLKSSEAEIRWTFATLLA